MLEFQDRLAPIQQKMISKIIYIVLGSLLILNPISSHAEVRTVEVSFFLKSPKTTLEQKIFNDRAVLMAQSKILDLYYENVSFLPKKINSLHRKKVENILRLSLYQSVSISNLKIKQRENKPGGSDFTFMGEVPAASPKINDELLMDELSRLIESHSSFLSPEFAMELALAYPELNLFEDALAFWRKILEGNSYAMLLKKPQLLPRDFKFSGIPLEMDITSSDVRGFLRLLDRAPFNPYVCQELIVSLKNEELHSLADRFDKPCLFLEKISDQGDGVLKIKSYGGDTVFDVKQKKSVVKELEILEKFEIIDPSAWLTKLIIRSFGDVPVNFLDDLDSGAHSENHDKLLVTSIDLDGQTDTSPMLEPLEFFTLLERFVEFERQPTLLSLRNLASALEFAGYIAISEVFLRQAER